MTARDRTIRSRDLAEVPRRKPPRARVPVHVTFVERAPHGIGLDEYKYRLRNQ
jgi:hypothetical protein